MKLTDGRSPSVKVQKWYRTPIKLRLKRGDGDVLLLSNEEEQHFMKLSSQYFIYVRNWGSNNIMLVTEQRMLTEKKLQDDIEKLENCRNV